MNLEKYRIWCSTDSQWEYIWKEEGEAAPTACPTNTAHTIDSNLTAIIDRQYEEDRNMHVLPGVGGPSLRIFGHKFAATPNAKVTTYRVIDFDCQIRYATLDAALKRGNMLEVWLQTEISEDVWVDAWHYLITYYTTAEDVQVFSNEALTVNNLNGYRFKIEYTDYTNTAHDVIVNAWGGFGG